MREWLELGPTPYEEECAQVGAPDYYERANLECKRTIAQLRKQFGPEPEGALLAVKSNSHDLGTYLEVVCYYDAAIAASVEYAFACDSKFPAYWDDAVKLELNEQQKHAVWSLIIAQINTFQRHLEQPMYTSEIEEGIRKQLELLKQVSAMIGAQSK